MQAYMEIVCKYLGAREHTLRAKTLDVMEAMINSFASHGWGIGQVKPEIEQDWQEDHIGLNPIYNVEIWEPKDKECWHCLAQYHHGLDKCPNCGAKYP